MTTYKDLKVKIKSGTWFTSDSFVVVEQEIECKKNGGVVSEKELFSGSLSDAESYIKLHENKKIIE